MSVVAPEGFLASGVWSAVKGSGKPDLTLIVSTRLSSAAAVFTRNRFRAAPVELSRARLAATKGKAAAIVVVSGCANALTGRPGMRDAVTVAGKAARLLGVREKHVLSASTGPIGTRLPVTRISRGLRRAVKFLGRDRACGLAAARGILTTDTRPKLAKAFFSDGSIRFCIGGIAKGVGMLAPNMATMLAFLTTDAEIPAGSLEKNLREAASGSFNEITVDGQTSTNDSVFLMANGAKSLRRLSPAGAERFKDALNEVCENLAAQLVADGEGARHTFEVRVRGARSIQDARRAARAVADSPLVKTMFHGRQPNWGRIAQALGQSGAAFDPKKVRIKVAGERAVERGLVIPPEFKVLTKMADSFIEVDIWLGNGGHSARVMACDLTEQYVRINAGYLS